MALSIKNTLISLSLSGAMLFAGYLSGENPLPHKNSNAPVLAKNAIFMPAHNKVTIGTETKSKRTFTTPYFSFGKSSRPVGVR